MFICINYVTVKKMGFTKLSITNGNEISESEFSRGSIQFSNHWRWYFGKTILNENQIIIDMGKGEITSTLDNVTTTIPVRSEAIISIRILNEPITDSQNILVHA